MAKILRRTTLLDELKRIKRQTKDGGDRIILDWAVRNIKAVMELQQAEAGERADVAELARILSLEDPR